MTKDIIGHYADFFKKWDAKMVGPKPSAKDLDTIHRLGARPGKQALANAMALRPNGVTGSEIVIVCGAPQLNKMRGFITDGLLKREAVPPRGSHTVYKLTVTAKGLTRTKATEAKDKPKAKKQRAKKTPAPQPAPQPVVEASTTQTA